MHEIEFPPHSVSDLSAVEKLLYALKTSESKLTNLQETGEQNFKKVLDLNSEIDVLKNIRALLEK